MTPESLAQEVNTIFSLPEVAIRVNEVIDQSDTVTRELEEIILCDPGLSANVLKLANSASYGLSTQVKSISRAITLLGFGAIRNLVLATAVTATFKGIPSGLVNMESYWLSSVTCGVVAKSLAENCRIDDKESFFTVGLLHGIGKIAFYSQYPKQSAQVLMQRGSGETAMVAAERRLFGFTYAEAGAELLKLWKLPAVICQMVARQLDPCCEGDFRKDEAILYVANKLSQAIEAHPNTQFSADEFRAEIEPAMWDGLALSEPDIDSISLEAPLEAFDMFKIIRPKAGLIY